MLSAIVASTGGPGTWTTPSVASARVIEWAIVNAVIVQDEHADAAHDEHQREHEQQVIVAEQDVLDAVQQIGRRGRREKPLGAVMSIHGCEG